MIDWGDEIRDPLHTVEDGERRKIVGGSVEISYSRASRPGRNLDDPE